MRKARLGAAYRGPQQEVGERFGLDPARPRSIVVFGDQHLTATNEPVTDFGPQFGDVVKRLFDTARTAPGLGVAAPQVGINQRLAVVDLSVGKDPKQQLVLANPSIIASSGRRSVDEGCLSFPGLHVTIVRPKSIVVRAQDLVGEWQEIEASELLAQAICHEVDHLDGVLLIDHLRGLKRRMFLKKIRKMRDLGVWST